MSNLASALQQALDAIRMNQKFMDDLILGKYEPMSLQDINIQDEGDYIVASKVPYMLPYEHLKERAELTFVSMYQKLSYRGGLISMKYRKPLVFQYFPTYDVDLYHINFRLRLQITVVEFRNVEMMQIPEFTYVANKEKPIEWRCGYCGIPNEMEARQCTQCGAGRALLIQELIT